MQPHSAARGAQAGQGARGRREGANVHAGEPRGIVDVRAPVPCEGTQRGMRQPAPQPGDVLDDPGRGGAQS